MNGPSFTDSTSMAAPNTPVATVAPRARNASTTASTSGRARSGGAAADHDGLRP